MKIKVTDFAKRHFNPKASGTKILTCSIENIEHMIDTFFKTILESGKPITGEFTKGIEFAGIRLLDGYADFCKLLIVENFTDAKVGTARITNENYQWLRSSYVARTDSELPVLTRTLHLPMPAEEAKYLVFVLYTKEHLKKEYEDTYEERFNENEKKTGRTLTKSDREALLSIDGLKFDLEEHTDCEWGIVSIMGQMINIEEPMTPATMIRNHLGTIYGGSGFEIDKEAYERSVLFWNNHALIR